MDDFDRELERRGLHFARYADDIIILVRSRSAGERVMASVTRWLADELKLTVNPKKSKVAHVSKCRFLSFSIRDKHVVLAEGVLEDFKDRIRRITRRNRGVCFAKYVAELNAYLRGWMNYFGLSETKRIWSPLDAWIRRRLRTCVWKHWKRKGTRVRKLLALGAARGYALATGASSKVLGASPNPWARTALSAMIGSTRRASFGSDTIGGLCPDFDEPRSARSARYVVWRAREGDLPGCRWSPQTAGI